MYMGNISSWNGQFQQWNKSKYKAQKVSIDGIEFDSKKEAKRWSELKLMERAGEIKNLQRQVKYELIPAQYEVCGGQQRCIERAVNYIADFVYIDKEGNEHVEDTKGFRTTEYVLKRKLMLYLKHIRITEL